MTTGRINQVEHVQVVWCHADNEQRIFCAREEVLSDFFSFIRLLYFSD